MLMMRSATTLLLLLCAALVPTLLQSQERTSIRGHVVDESGRPVQGAQVVVMGTSSAAFSDAEGVFSIVGAPEGLHVLEASRVQFSSARVRVRIVPERQQQVDFRLYEVETTTRVAAAAPPERGAGIATR